MRNRFGRGGLGCIGTLVIVGIVVGLGARFIPVLLRYGQFHDEMRADARFGTTLADSVIRIRLTSLADTLGLPPEAKRIIIRRRPGHPPMISISSEYTERVNVPIFGIKLLHFKPSAEEAL